MKKTYFADCRCSEDLKELYRKLALANHPDRGGDLETMKAINAEFDTAFESLKNIHRSIKEGAEPYYTAAKSTTETAKDTLKAMGFRWAAKKLAWSWHKDEDWTSSRGKYSMDDIRGRYGSTQFEAAEEIQQLTA